MFRVVEEEVEELEKDVTEVDVCEREVGERREVGEVGDVGEVGEVGEMVGWKPGAHSGNRQGSKRNRGTSIASEQWLETHCFPFIYFEHVNDGNI